MKFHLIIITVVAKLIIYYKIANVYNVVIIHY